MNTEVKVGQQWESMDRRDRAVGGRIVEVISVDDVAIKIKNVKTGKVTNILPSRFRPGATGFKLVKDTHATETEAA